MGPKGAGSDIQARKRISSGVDKDDYRPNILPKDFHQRVVDLEIKLELKGVADDNEQVKQIRELMGLYSNAIEYYNRETDEENQTYYVDKLQRLND